MVGEWMDGCGTSVSRTHRFRQFSYLAALRGSGIARQMRRWHSCTQGADIRPPGQTGQMATPRTLFVMRERAEAEAEAAAAGRVRGCR